LFCLGLALEVDVYFLGIALEGVLQVLVAFAGVALSTQRHVHICTANHVLAVLAGSAERERSVLLAQLADSRQFLNFLALGNQVED